MSERLSADFELQYARGPSIRAAFDRPGEGFSSTVLFGPSGSGKTSILRCLAGLEKPVQGFIRLGARTWFDSAAGVDLSPQARGVGFLFQDYALFPHLTVERNIAYGLGKAGRAERRERISKLVELLKIGGLESRYPRQLSAGQQQRVALARAVAPRPRLLLLDEPLSALDAPTRQSLRLELRHVLAALATPTILVTHDPLEAVALADHAIILCEGRVRQQGSIDEVFSRPVDPQVARIVGVETIEPAVVASVSDGVAIVRAAAAELAVAAAGAEPGPVHLCIRGEEVTLERGGPAQTTARNRLAATILAVYDEGAAVRVIVDCGFKLTALVTRPAARELELAEGQSVVAVIKAQAIHLLPRFLR